MNKKKSGEQKLKPLVLKNLLAVAGASASSRMFQRLYFKKGGKTVDILRNGDLSCAFFVSSILKMFSLIKNIHATVNGTLTDMKASGWKAISKPKAGAVIVWKPQEIDGEIHRHIGIYLGNGKAISNNSKKRAPTVHAWNFRPIEKIFWLKI